MHNRSEIELTSIILGSESPYRSALLSRFTSAFRTAKAPIDEYAVLGRSPREQAILRARAKAAAVATAHPHALVIGADQVMGLGEKSFDKVQTRELAKERLKLLSGKTHELHSAVCLTFCDGANSQPQVLREFVITALMPMRRLDDADIESYLDTKEWEGVAGSYQFEKKGALLFDATVKAEDSTIIGLPLPALNEALRSLGVNLLTNPKGPWRCRP